MKLRRRCSRQSERIMKLPLITASILAYIVLAAAWLCYTQLIP
jgi:hypothetical protein